MPAAAVPVRSVATAQGSWMQREQTQTAVAVGVQLWADDRTRGAAAMAAVMAEMQRIDRRYSARRADSDLSAINSAGAVQAVRVSDECFQLLARAQEFSRLTQGAFDVTFTSAGPRSDQQGEPAEPITLARPVQAIGWRQLQLDAMAPSVRFARAGVRVDLGGFARAHALERSVALLRRHGIRHAKVSAGGDFRLLGDRRGSPWTLAVRDRHDAALAQLPLQDVAVSTVGGHGGTGLPSGPDQRSVHPLMSICSATIVAADGLSAHAWGQAVLMLGVERGLRLVEQQQGVEAVIVDGDGRLHGSRGFADLLGDAPATERRASA